MKSKNNIKKNNIKKNKKVRNNIKYKKIILSKRKNKNAKDFKTKKRKDTNKKKLKKYIIKGGGDTDLSRIAASNIGENKSNSLIEKVLGGKNDKGLLSSVIEKISLPGFIGNNAVGESKQMEKKKELEEKNEKNRQDEIEERLKDGDNEYFEQKAVEERELEIAREEDNQKFSEEVAGKGLFSGIGAQIKRSFDGADRRISGISKDNAEKAEKIKKLARTRTCSPVFVTGLNDLLGTCAKEELINVYNKSVQKLKSKRDMFSFETNEKINNLEEISFQEEQENNKDTNIEGVKLKEVAGNDSIRKLENIIERKLNFYDPNKKKIKKKLKKNHPKFKKEL